MSEVYSDKGLSSITSQIRNVVKSFKNERSEETSKEKENQENI